MTSPNRIFGLNFSKTGIINTTFAKASDYPGSLIGGRVYPVHNHPLTSLMNGADSENLVVAGEKFNKRGEKVLKIECMTTHKIYEDVASSYVLLGKYHSRFPTKYFLKEAAFYLEDNSEGWEFN